jgi:ubiquinone/menaquinone biosynthesis C-methylase UbiE
MTNQNQSKPDPEMIAQQLRKPTRPFAEKIAEKMEQVNAPLIDLTLETMQLADSESVLEIGFGSGRFFEKIFSKAKGLQVSGIDYSQEMVKMAKSNNQRFIDSGKLNLELGNSDALPFADNSFDKVFCNMVVYFWDHPSRHLKEIQRVLKPQGRFYTGIRTKESMLQLPFTQYGFTLYDQNQWHSVLEQNGFIFIGVNKIAEPLVEEDEGPLRFESICLIAEKNKERF